MGNIVLLDELTINQIAAGEVIERPASVVKEMVENSIDAGATEINIEIKNGGISYIRVSDNGKGISQDDLEIAFERHATSKIRKAEDLETVRSMGFRGEALASIAAIANVELVSKTQEQANGYRVVVEAGQVLEKEETGCQNGTSITVRNLFFNTPVRYKFLKKDYTELGYIEDVITRLALVNPQIAFKLVNAGKTIIQTTGDNNRKNCSYSIFGKDIANGIIEVFYEYENIIVEGVIGKPEIARNNRTQQMFFVNNRYVKDKTLSASIEQGYKGMLTIGKHAFCVLNIKIDPTQVDVNVHPAKLEVRFKDENKVFKAIYNAIRDNLLKTDLVRNVEKQTELYNNINTSAEKSSEQINIQNEENKNTFSNLFKKISKEGEKQNIAPSNEQNLVEQLYNQKKNGENGVQLNETEEEKPILNVAGIEETTQFLNETQKMMEEIRQNINAQTNGETPIKNTTETPVDFKEMYKKTFGKEITEEKIEETNKDIQYEDKQEEQQKIENISVFENKEVYNQNISYKFIGIAFSTYIILEIENDIYILDQHAAHERIMYEKVKKNFYSDDAKESQLMLLPDVITLTHKEMNVVRENKQMFEKAGFELEEFGDNTVKLMGVPNICMELDTKELFMEILDAIDTSSITTKQEKEDKFIATVACKAAVKANMALSRQEVDYLMEDLLKLPNPFTCPHGRPTAIRMSKTDIEKKFSRR